MNYLFTILFGLIFISPAALAAGTPEQRRAPIVAEEQGVAAAAPQGLHLKIVPTGFQLDWTVSSDDPGIVTGYEIVRADRFTGPYDPVATVGQGTSRYIDSTALPEIIYFYKVRAIAGKGHSPFSNTVSGER